MKKEYISVLWSVAACLAVHILLFILCSQSTYQFLPMLEENRVREAAVVLVLLASVVMWGYALYITLTVGRGMEKKAYEKMLFAQFFIWLMVIVIISAFFYIAGYGMDNRVGDLPGSVWRVIHLCIGTFDYELCCVVNRRLKKHV